MLPGEDFHVNLAPYGYEDNEDMILSVCEFYKIATQEFPEIRFAGAGRRTRSSMFNYCALVQAGKTLHIQLMALIFAISRGAISMISVKNYGGEGTVGAYMKQFNYYDKNGFTSILEEDKTRFQKLVTRFCQQTKKNLKSTDHHSRKFTRLMLGTFCSNKLDTSVINKLQSKEPLRGAVIFVGNANQTFGNKILKLNEIFDTVLVNDIPFKNVNLFNDEFDEIGTTPGRDNGKIERQIFYNPFDNLKVPNLNEDQYDASDVEDESVENKLRMKKLNGTLFGTCSMVTNISATIPAVLCDAEGSYFKPLHRGFVPSTPSNYVGFCDSLDDSKRIKIETMENVLVKINKKEEINLGPFCRQLLRRYVDILGNSVYGNFDDNHPPDAYLSALVSTAQTRGSNVKQRMLAFHACQELINQNPLISSSLFVGYYQQNKDKCFRLIVPKRTVSTIKREMEVEVKEITPEMLEAENTTKMPTVENARILDSLRNKMCLLEIKFDKYSSINQLYDVIFHVTKDIVSNPFALLFSGVLLGRGDSIKDSKHRFALTDQFLSLSPGKKFFDYHQFF